MVPDSKDLRLDIEHQALIVKIRLFGKCYIKEHKEGHDIVADSEKVGSLWFNIATKIDFRYCVIIGIGKGRWINSKEPYYVLVVGKQCPGGGYKRLGVGEIEPGYVLKETYTSKLW
jgi:hypothetical protein